MTIDHLSHLATDLIPLANATVAAASETTRASVAPEWLLIGLGSLLVISAKTVLFVKASRALSSNANK